MLANSKGLDDTEQFLRGLSNTTRQLLSNTANTLAKKGQVHSADVITQNLNLDKSLVKEKIELVPSTARTLIAKIRMESRGLSLANYSPQQVFQGKRRAGVSVAVKRHRKTLKKGFLFKNKQGRTLVAKRLGKGKNNFRVAYGPSASQAFNTLSPDITQFIDRQIDGVFNQQYSELL